MGFGWLLCGYFATFMMSFGMGDYSFIATLIGGLIAWHATLRLKDYCPSFLNVAACAVLKIVLAFYGALKLLSDLFLWQLPILDKAVLDVVGNAEFLLDMAFQFCMLYAIWKLSREVDVSKIYDKVGLHMSVFAVCTVLHVVLWIAPALAAWQNGVLAKILTLFVLIGYLLCSWLLYRCYQYICAEGEEYGKERKPSRFAFINRMREKADARDQQMFEDAQTLVRRGMEKRQEKKERKNKKKKK